MLKTSAKEGFRRRLDEKQRRKRRKWWRIKKARDAEETNEALARLYQMEKEKVDIYKVDPEEDQKPKAMKKAKRKWKKRRHHRAYRERVKLRKAKQREVARTRITTVKAAVEQMAEVLAKYASLDKLSETDRAMACEQLGISNLPRDEQVCYFFFIFVFKKNKKQQNCA